MVHAGPLGAVAGENRDRDAKDRAVGVDEAEELAGPTPPCRADYKPGSASEEMKPAPS